MVWLAQALKPVARTGCGTYWDDWAWMVSWMSMNRIGQDPGRGSGNSFRP
jgi:hypothetical protein